MRGAPGSGKSTWIKQHGLEQFTLEADKFRTLVQNPVMTEDGNFCISQKNDHQAWDMLLQCLEQRMQRGDFTVVDATHTTQRAVQRYLTLAEQYGYKCFVKEFNLSLEQTLAQNLQREEYKHVPETIVRNAYAKAHTSVLKGFTKVETLAEIEACFEVVESVDDYQQVKVVGDIQGCYEPLVQAIGKYPADVIKQDIHTLWVFVGDFLDRGIQNAEALKFELDILGLPNVRVLRSNHTHEFDWAAGREIKSKEFLEGTLPQILDYYNEYTVNMLMTQLRAKEQYLLPYYLFSFRGKRYIVTHGGLTAVPKLLYVSEQTAIKGAGSRKVDLGKVYDANFEAGLCRDFIQLHGHRGVSSGKYSYCLESAVERNGYLSIATITDEVKVDKTYNAIFDPKYQDCGY